MQGPKGVSGRGPIESGPSAEEAKGADARAVNIHIDPEKIVTRARAEGVSGHSGAAPNRFAEELLNENLEDEQGEFDIEHGEAAEHYHDLQRVRPSDSKSAEESQGSEAKGDFEEYHDDEEKSGTPSPNKVTDSV